MKCIYIIYLGVDDEAHKIEDLIQLNEIHPLSLSLSAWMKKILLEFQ